MGDDGVSISRENTNKHGRRLASGGWESKEGAGDMGEAGEDSGTGGGGPESVTQFLYCCDTAGPPLRGGDLGTYQEGGGCHGHVPGQGSTAADGAHATPWEGRKVAVPPPGGCYQVSGDSAGEDIGPPETEYGRAIRCDAADSGTL